MHTQKTNTRRGSRVSLLPSLLSACLLASVGFAPGANADPTGYHVVAITSAGFGNAYAISENGKVAGQGTHNSVNEAFKFSSSALTWLGSLETNGTSTAYGINDSGEVCGVSATSDAFPFAAFVYDDTNGIRGIGNGFVYAWAINNNGIVTGTRSLIYDVTYGLYTEPTNAYRYNMRSPASTTLDHAWVNTTNGDDGFAINDSGVVGGMAEIQGTGEYPSVFRAARWGSGGTTPTSLPPIYTDGDGTGYGINEDGDIVGTSGSRAALWPIGGGVTNLGQLSSMYTVARDINNEGDIVGNAGTSSAGWVRYYGTSTLVNLNTKICSHHKTSGVIDLDGNIYNGPDIVIYEANAINDSGKIVGKAYIRNGTNSTGVYPVLLTPEY